MAPPPVRPIAIIGAAGAIGHAATAELSLDDQVFSAAVTGGTANWIGPPDLPHEFVFTPDAGLVVADLLAREDSFGEVWNLGGAGTITRRELIAAAYRLWGLAPRFRTIGPTLLRVGGWVSPLLRELREMYYLQTTPVILDDAKLRRFLGTLQKTQYPEGIRRTMDWYTASRHAGSGLPGGGPA